MDSILFYIIILLIVLFYISEKAEHFSTKNNCSICNDYKKHCQCKKNRFCDVAPDKTSKIKCVQSCGVNKPLLVGFKTFNQVPRF
jgi:hypothetical protein